MLGRAQFQSGLTLRQFMVSRLLLAATIWCLVMSAVVFCSWRWPQGIEYRNYDVSTRYLARYQIGLNRGLLSWFHDGQRIAGDAELVDRGPMLRVPSSDLAELPWARTPFQRLFASSGFGTTGPVTGCARAFTA